MIAPLDPVSHARARAQAQGRAFLSIDHVDKSFVRNGQTSEVLRDVSLKIERGEFVSIIGQIGRAHV